MAAPASDKNVPQTEFDVPEGWTLVTEYNKKGEIVKYYTNNLGQRFYNESDLMKNIKNAKETGLAIYAPVCVKSKAEAPRCASAQLGVDLDGDDIQCASALLELSFPTRRTISRRSSRRVAGLGPELCVDADFSSRPLEYIIKDKTKH